MIHLISIAHAGAIDEAPGIPQLLLNILNFLLQIFGIIAVIALIVSGIVYLTASGNEDRISLGKKSVMYSIIGIIVALAGMVIVKGITRFLE